MLFRCNKCRRTYKDYMPIDDTCSKCGSGTIRLVKPRKRLERSQTKPTRCSAYARANM